MRAVNGTRTLLGCALTAKANIVPTLLTVAVDNMRRTVLKTMLKMCDSFTGKCPCLLCVRPCHKRCDYHNNATNKGYDVDTEMLCAVAREYCERRKDG